MAMERWDARFRSSTRGRIVALLRRGVGTVKELAAALEMTPNAVRWQLSELEADGLVVQDGVRRGWGKPAYVFRLADDAESAPRAYDLLAGELVADLRFRGGGGDAALAGSLRALGSRAGQATGVRGDTADARLERTLALLEPLAGAVDVIPGLEGTLVCGHGCPLAALVTDEPRVCAFLAGFLEGAVGAPVRQACEHEPRPRCRFHVATGAAGSETDSHPA